MTCCPVTCSTVSVVWAKRQRPRAYAITDAGRQRFREIMLDTKSAAGDYDRLFRIKVLYFQYLGACCP